MRRGIYSRCAWWVLLVLLIQGGLWVWGGTVLPEKRAANRATCTFLGPNEGALRLDFEYSLGFLETHQASGFDASSFSWEPLPKGTTVTTDHVVKVEGRNFYLLTFSRELPSTPRGVEVTTVLLVRESSPHYYQPVFIALPDAATFDGELVSNRKNPMAYTLSLKYSGTGALYSSYLFDLRGTPRMIVSAHGGRLDGDPHEAKYQKALSEMRARAKRARGE